VTGLPTRSASPTNARHHGSSSASLDPCGPSLDAEVAELAPAADHEPGQLGIVAAPLDQLARLRARVRLLRLQLHPRRPAPVVDAHGPTMRRGDPRATRGAVSTSWSRSPLSASATKWVAPTGDGGGGPSPGRPWCRSPVSMVSILPLSVLVVASAVQSAMDCASYPWTVGRGRASRWARRMAWWRLWRADSRHRSRHRSREPCPY